MTTLEQAKRLKDAGWEQGINKTKMMWVFYAPSGIECYWRHEICDYFQGDETINSPDEKEMMDFLYNYIFQIEPFPSTNPPDVTGWRIVGLSGWETEHADLTEALVQACEASLKW